MAHIPIHDLAPSASLHAGLYYIPALTQPPFKSGASAFTSNHQTPYYTAPLPSTLPREAISRLDFPCLTLIPFPSPLQIAMPIYKVAWIGSIGVGTETHAISV